MSVNDEFRDEPEFCREGGIITGESSIFAPPTWHPFPMNIRDTPGYAAFSGINIIDNINNVAQVDFSYGDSTSVRIKAAPEEPASVNDEFRDEPEGQIYSVDIPKNKEVVRWTFTPHMDDF